MAAIGEEERDMRSYLRSGEATDKEIEDFINWCHVICLGGEGHATG